MKKNKYQTTKSLLSKADNMKPLMSRAKNVIHFTERFRNLLPEHLRDHVECCVPKPPSTLLIYVDDPAWNVPVRMNVGAILASQDHPEWGKFRTFDVKTTANVPKSRPTHTMAKSSTGSACLASLAKHTEHPALKDALTRLSADLKES